MNTNNGKPRLPNAEEAKRIDPIIREEFKKEGVESVSLSFTSIGGLRAVAAVTPEQQERLTSSLFAHGIILVKIYGRDSWGFAVRG